MDDNKPETVVEELEKIQKKGPKLGIGAVIILFVLMFAIGFIVGHFIVETDKDKNDKSNDKNNTEEKKNDDKLDDEPKEVTNSDTIEKLNTFIKAALYGDTADSSVSNDFAKGYSSLIDDYKLVITYNSLIKIKKESKKVEEVPEKYNDELYYWTGATITELPIESFKNEYKNLFNEEMNATLSRDSINVCPFIYKVDEELGNIYFSNQCGGTGSPVMKYKTYKITEDNDFYYIYQYVGTERFVGTSDNPDAKEYKKVVSDEIVDVQSFDGNEDKFESLIWKFDKNFNFISTQNIG